MGCTVLCSTQYVKLHSTRPGKPVDGSFIESVNGKLRDECSNRSWFAGDENARRTVAPGGASTTSSVPTAPWGIGRRLRCGLPIESVIYVLAVGAGHSILTTLTGAAPGGPRRGWARRRGTPSRG